MSDGRSCDNSLLSAPEILYSRCAEVEPEYNFGGVLGGLHVDFRLLSLHSDGSGSSLGDRTAGGANKIAARGRALS